MFKNGIFTKELFSEERMFPYTSFIREIVDVQFEAGINFLYVHLLNEICASKG